jgi:hypothetical protein
MFGGAGEQSVHCRLYDTPPKGGITTAEAAGAGGLKVAERQMLRRMLDRRPARPSAR